MHGVICVASVAMLSKASLHVFILSTLDYHNCNEVIMDKMHFLSLTQNT